MIDTILASDNHFLFKKNILEELQKLNMTNDGKIRDETLLKYINPKAERGCGFSKNVSSIQWMKA